MHVQYFPSKVLLFLDDGHESNRTHPGENQGTRSAFLCTVSSALPRFHRGPGMGIAGLGRDAGRGFGQCSVDTTLHHLDSMYYVCIRKLVWSGLPSSRFSLLLNSPATTPSCPFQIGLRRIVLTRAQYFRTLDLNV